MTTSGYEARYHALTDEEIKDLVRAGEDAFEPTAWLALQAECVARRLSMDEGRDGQGHVSTPDVDPEFRDGEPGTSSRAGDSGTPLDPAEGASTSGDHADLGHRGWITIFVCWIAIVSAAFAGGFVAGVLGTASTAADYLRLLLVLIPAALPVLGIVLIARHAPTARPFWITLLTIRLVLAVMSLDSPTTSAQSFGAVLYSGGWLLYWLRSKRVAREFRRPPKWEPATGGSSKPACE